MASELQFVMHPNDEALFAEELLREEGVRLIDGPRWPSASPSTTRDLGEVDDYCIVWSPSDLDPLTAEYIPTCNDWYCRSEYATIQFLRSQLEGTVLSAGRIAFHHFPDDFDQSAANAISKRFNRLRRYIKKHFHNSALGWKVDPTDLFDRLWVGPHAVEWLRESSEHWADCPGAAVLAPAFASARA